MSNKTSLIILLISMALCFNFGYTQQEFSVAFKVDNEQGWRLKGKKKLSPSGKTAFNYSYTYDKEYLETFKSGSTMIRYVYDNTKTVVTSHYVKKNGELKSAKNTITFDNGLPTNIAFRKNYKNYDIKMQFSEGKWTGFQDKNSEHAMQIQYEEDKVIRATLVTPIVGSQNAYRKYNYTFNWENNRLENIIIKTVPFEASENNSNASKDLDVRYTYNEANQIVEIKALPLFRYTFTYDENGNVTERIEHVGADHFVYEWEKGSSNTSILLNDYFNWLKNPLILPFSL